MIFDRLQKTISDIEKEYSPIEQHHVEKLFSDIYFFVENSLVEAAKKNKPCLFIIGELHNFGLGKNSLFVQYIFSQVVHHFGIDSIHIEGDALPGKAYAGDDNWISIDMQKNKDYKFWVDSSYSQSHLYNKLIKQNKFIYKLTESHQASKLVYSDFEAREKEIINNLLLEQNSSIFNCGAFHAPAIYLDAEINNKFEVRLINTVYDKVLDESAEHAHTLFRREEFTLENKKRDNIMKNTTTFLLRAQLSDVIPIDVFNMVDMAKISFYKKKEQNNLPENAASLEMKLHPDVQREVGASFINNNFFGPRELYQLPSNTHNTEARSSFSDTVAPAVLIGLAAYSLFKVFSFCRKKSAHASTKAVGNNPENKAKIL